MLDDNDESPRRSRSTREGPYRTPVAPREAPRFPRHGGVDWSSIVLLLPALVIGTALLVSSAAREAFSQRAAGVGAVMVIIAGVLIAGELLDGWHRRRESSKREDEPGDSR